MDGQLVRRGHTRDDERPALSDDRERGRDHLLVNRADSDDGLVRTLAPRQFVHFLGGLGRIAERMCRTEFQRGVALELDGIDRDDVLGSGVHCALDGIDADSADAVHHSDVARSHTARIVRTAPACRHAAADQDRGFQRKPVIDLDHGVLRYRRSLRKRPEHAHGTEFLTATVESKGTVGHTAVQDGRAHVAQALPPGRAVAAVTATRDEAAHHVVARFDLGDARTDLFDDAGTLVTAHDRKARRQITVGEVQVGMAQPGSDVPDQHFTVARTVEIQLDDLERPARFEQNCGGCLHGSPPSISIRSRVWRSVRSARIECQRSIRRTPESPTRQRGRGQLGPYYLTLARCAVFGA